MNDSGGEVNDTTISTAIREVPARSSRALRKTGCQPEVARGNLAKASDIVWLVRRYDFAMTNEKRTLK